LAQFHEKFYAPSNTIIAVVGDVSLREAMPKLEAAFGDWSLPAVSLPVPPEPKRQSEPKTKYVFMDKEQTNIFLGHVGVSRKDPDYYALEVMDTILGGAPGSGTFTGRIPFRLRDQQGLAYSTFSSITRDATVDRGRFLAYIGCSPKNMAKGIEGLRKEIREIFDHPVSQSEIDDAKAYLTGHFVFDFQTNAQIARFLLNAEIYGLGFDYIQRYPRIIQAMTIEDVSRAAQKHLDPDSLTLVVVGPVNEKGEIVSAKEKGHSE
jgi:zinc protease